MTAPFIPSFRLKSWGPFALMASFLGSVTALLSLTKNTLVFALTSYHSFCMPIPQPPYPSFTLVMSSAPFAAHDNMRLPAYRGSHLARFHPYSRAHPSLREERFLTTLDCRFSEHSSCPLQCVDPILCTMVPEDGGKAENRSETSTVAAGSIRRRQKLKSAAGRLSAIVVTLRRMYRGMSVKQAEQKLEFELMN